MRARCHQRDQSATISEPAPCCALRASVPNSNYIISSLDLFRPIYLVIYFFYYTSTQLGSTALKLLASAVPIDLATVNRRAAWDTGYYTFQSGVGARWCIVDQSVPRTQLDPCPQTPQTVRQHTAVHPFRADATRAPLCVVPPRLGEVVLPYTSSRRDGCGQHGSDN